MFQLVTGGSGSGKSAYAEELLAAPARFSDAASDTPALLRIYLATMKPYGKETLEKIRRHRRLRAEKGFVTVECPKGLDEVVLLENDGVLLECIANLAANELYREDGSLNGRQETADRILSGIRSIRRQTGHLVVVTNEVCADTGDYSSETREYMALLGALNRQLARMADTVTEVVYGIPVSVK